jgi:uncharacterized protein (DUF58 family)
MAAAETVLFSREESTDRLAVVVTRKLPVTEQLNYLQPEVLAKLTGLDLKARMIVEGFVSGLHKSPFHGFSVEFAEHREYVPGDDLRHVDWKVFGKSDRFYVKQYEEETNFACHILVDASDSMSYRSRGAAMSKLEYAKHIAAALAYIVVQQQDAVGLVTVGNRVIDILRASSQASHLKQLHHVLEQTQPSGETALGPVLHDIAERIRKRGLIIVLSDFFDDPESLLLGLKHLHHRRHDVSLLQIIDPAEQDFPFEDPTLFKGLELPTQLLSEPKSIRRAYRQEFDAFLRTIQQQAHDLNMEYALLRSDQPLDVAITSVLRRR